MIAKGHCRYDLNDEMSEFYDTDAITNTHVSGASRVDDETLRLPSGKILSHRAHIPTQPRFKAGSQSPASNEDLPELSGCKGESQSLAIRDRKDKALQSQIAQLSKRDQLGLAHLVPSEQRALLTTWKKQVDQVRRAQRQMQSRVERAGNKTYMKHFVSDVPGRRNG